MIKNFFSARLLVAALCVFVGAEALAEMTLTRPAPAPSVLTSGNTTMWLDASDVSNFTRQGEYVTQWRNIANEENPAVPKVAANGSDIVYGTVGITNSVSAFRMGAGGSRIELGYNRLTDIRTVFWVMDIVDQMNGGFFLGDTTDNSSINFHRGEQGQYAYNNANCYFKDAETIVKCDGTQVADKLTEHPPTGLHVYSAVMSNASSSNRLSQDRGQASRNGGRALSELIVLNQALSEAEVTEVETYLTQKWMNGNWGNEISIDDAKVNLKAIIDFMSNNYVNSARLKFTQAAEIIVDAALDGKTLIIDNSYPVSFSLKEGGTVEAFKNIMFLNEIAPLTISNLTGLLRMNTDGSLEIEGTLEIDVPYGEELRIDSLIGGKLVKTGDGTLRIGRVNNTIANVKDTTIEIKAGKVLFHESDGAIFLETSTYILHDGAKLDNYGWPKVDGTLTFESDADVSVFANTGNGTTGSRNSAQFEGNPTIIKKGTGRIDLMCGASNDSSHNNVIMSVEIEDGTLAFGGTAAKVIKTVLGKGALEQAGGGVMTISGASNDVILSVSSGTLNNECAVGDGSISLAGLKIAEGATYTMKGAIDHLNIAKVFHMEGSEHDGWYVTLADGATISTNPQNPMTLQGLEFGSSVILGANQTVGTILANTSKSRVIPSSVKSEDAKLANFEFDLSYNTGAIVVSSKTTAKITTVVVPGAGLNGAVYKVYIDMSELEREKDYQGGLWVRFSVGKRKGEAEIINRDENGWYAIISNCGADAFSGKSLPVEVEIGTNGVEGFKPIDSYGDIMVNVRPDATSWFKEKAYERWATGSWDTTGEYITISDGYVQVEGNDVTFSPRPPHGEDVDKIYLSVVFGEGLKLEVLNALAEENQIAGLALVNDNDEYNYAVIDPETHQYVEAILDKQTVVKVDPKAEHNVEIVISKAQNQRSVSYKVDGAILKVDNKGVFALANEVEIDKINFSGIGAVKELSAEEYSTNLAKYNEVEYRTIEEALKAALAESEGKDTITVEPLWNVNWTPNANFLDKTIVFNNKEGTCEYKVDPKTINELASKDMVLRENYGDDGKTIESYSIISKFLTISIPDPEAFQGSRYVYVESITTNSIHLGWAYDYKTETPAVAKAKIIYEDDVTIEFSSNLEVKKDSFVNRKTLEWLKSITLKKVRYNTTLGETDIPMIDSQSIEGLAAFASLGVDRSKAKMVAEKSASINILEFSTNAEGATFQVALVDREGNDISQLVTEKIGDMVLFSTDLVNWTPVGAQNVTIIQDENGVDILFAKQEGASSGFYKVVIPNE